MIKTKLILVGLLCFVVGAVVDAVICQEQSADKDRQIQRAQLFDSYPGINSEDLMARLDNLAVQLENNHDARIHIIVYGPKGEGSGTGKFLLRLQADYLLNTRGIAEERIINVYGGRYKDPKEARTELWIVPAGADPPMPRLYETNIRELKGKFAEYNQYDGLPDCDGPCGGSVTLAAFADALSEQPESVAYVVAYNQQGAAIGTWRRVAKSETDDLERRGIAADRIKIIFAGTTKLTEDEYSQQARVQLWLLPKDSAPPVKETKQEDIPKKAVQLGTFHIDELKYLDREKWAFEGFADVLKADENLGVCIIVRPPLAPGFRDPEIPAIPDEPPDIDLMKLIEKWRTQLAKSYQIEGRRIFVITASADEGNDGTIETWIIPPGAALPDPYAHDSPDPILRNDKPMEF